MRYDETQPPDGRVVHLTLPVRFTILWGEGKPRPYVLFAFNKSTPNKSTPNNV
ncbi:MAG: hypothetical protein LBQ66_06805 [Planctomycetaceae bacterium]|nr:hypothetical protein [Planctomycetaceae bacterium]